MLRSVIPLQFLHTERFPFFGIFIISPSVRSSGRVWVSQNVFTIERIRCALTLGSALRSSGEILSDPGDLLPLRALIVVIISDKPGHSVDTSSLFTYLCPAHSYSYNGDCSSVGSGESSSV